MAAAVQSFVGVVFSFVENSRVKRRRRRERSIREPE